MNYLPIADNPAPERIECDLLVVPMGWPTGYPQRRFSMIYRLVSNHEKYDGQEMDWHDIGGNRIDSDAVVTFWRKTPDLHEYIAK